MPRKAAKAKELQSTDIGSASGAGDDKTTNRGQETSADIKEGLATDEQKASKACSDTPIDITTHPQPSTVRVKSNEDVSKAWVTNEIIPYDDAENALQIEDQPALPNHLLDQNGQDAAQIPSTVEATPSPETTEKKPDLDFEDEDEDED